MPRAPRRVAAVRLPLVVALTVAAAVGCGSGTERSSTVGGGHGKPDLAAFLQLPVASPSACPANVNGTTAGRRSPWVGTVDVSVFLPPGASEAQVAALRRTVGAEPGVARTYVETAAEAYAEFQRLYTCSAGVPAASVPASIRVVLERMSLARRDALVAQLLRLPGVETVSCDPSTPCVDVVRSARPSPGG